MTMLPRIVVLTVVAAITLLAPVHAADEPANLKLGEKFEGELTRRAAIEWPGFATVTGYATELPVVLKAGQSLKVSARVLGTDRRVCLALRDPTGRSIKATGWLENTRTSILSIEEVNTSGKFTIVVASDLIGAFSLQATGPSDDERDAKALEEKIAELEKELAELRAKLKAKKEKKPQ
jgi:hypothetical protein